MIDISQMGNFAQIRGNSATIYNQGVNGEIKSGGTYKGPLGALRRSEGEKAANNAARSELLVALSKTYGMKDAYTREADGKIKFSDTFVADLKKKIGVDMAKTLGLDSKFEMKDGYVVCGKPLTERRISAVTAQMRKQQASDMKRDMAMLGLTLGMIDMDMPAKAAKSKRGVDQFIEDLIGITGGDPDLVTEENVERAVRSSYGKVFQWNKSRGERGFKGDVKDPFRLDTPDTKSKKLANVVNDAKKIIQARGGLRTENAGSIKQLSKTFGSPKIQFMTMTEEAKFLETELAKFDAKKVQYLERDLDLLVDTNSINRHYNLILEGTPVTSKTTEAAKDKLKSMFTTNGVLDKNALSFFCQLVNSGGDNPEVQGRFDRMTSQFKYAPGEGKAKDTVKNMTLKRLPDGHYRFETSRMVNGFDSIMNGTMLLKYGEGRDVARNYYSYFASMEFYFDNGKPVVKLLAPPQMAWRFASNPTVKDNPDGIGEFKDEDVYVEK